MHCYCSNNAVTLLNTAKSIKVQSIMNFKNLKFTSISSASQPASQPDVRPGCASATALEFLHNKGNHVGFTNCCSEKRLSTAPWCFFYPLLVNKIFKLFTER